ncbi:MAG: UbiA prenyltransferase family protein [Endomicrobium sp.]|jgi:4-hydroxybenzoate polyprenyltransferase|nr:UbiA prenyltransferase family protein [Endomicrobium sp.]
MLKIVRNYCQLLRLQHYLKNSLIFIPLFFSQNFFNISCLLASLAGFCCFSLTASLIYIINDMRDIAKDRQHKTKRLRPLASGAISVKQAANVLVILIIVLGVLLLTLQDHIGSKATTTLFLYLFLNIGYSYGLKNIPIVEILILASGFILRIIFGAYVVNVDISIWLYLTVIMGALYLGFGKRRNELQKNTRKVLNYYTYNFLDKNMYMCQILFIVFYSLWSIDSTTIARFHTAAFSYTVPILFLILMKYNLNLERGSDGDPIPIILHDKILLALCGVYSLTAFYLVYFL